MLMAMVLIAEMGMGVSNGFVSVRMGVPTRTVFQHFLCLSIKMVMGMVRVLITWGV
jgi:hypothetical protein